MRYVRQVSCQGLTLTHRLPQVPTVSYDVARFVRPWCMCRLLEARIEEQEGEHGTGMLEEDLQLLQAATGQAMETQAQRQKHACITYRWVGWP